MRHRDYSGARPARRAGGGGGADRVRPGRRPGRRLARCPPISPMQDRLTVCPPQSQSRRGSGRPGRYRCGVRRRAARPDPRFRPSRDRCAGGPPCAQRAPGRVPAVQRARARQDTQPRPRGGRRVPEAGQGGRRSEQDRRLLAVAGRPSAALAGHASASANVPRRRRATARGTPTPRRKPTPPGNRDPSQGGGA